jgi:formate hydrogenlyase transcriptional activator
MGQQRKKTAPKMATDQVALQTILDCHPAFTQTSDPDGNYYFFCRQWLEYTGRSLAELQGTGWVSAIHPDDVAGVAEDWNHAVSTGTPVYHESRVRRFDGVYHWFLHRVVPIRDSNEKIIKWCGSSIVIEERINAERRAVESEKDFRRTIDTIPAHIFTLSPDGEVNFCNQRALEYSGRTLEDFRGRRWKENGIVHEEDVPTLLEALRVQIPSKEPFECAIRVRRSDGQYRWFSVGFAPLLDASGELVRWCVASIDIDDQKRAEAQIRRDQEEMRQVIDLIPQQVFVLSPDGQVIYCNRVMLEYTGLSLEESLSEDVSKTLFHPEEAERVIEERKRKIKLGVPFEIEARLRRHDGEYQWFLIRLNPLRDEKERILHWYGTRTNIEERKQAEESIQKENIVLREEIDKTSMFEEIIGTSPAIRTVLRSVSKVAPTNSSVLIMGETGTGKELIARAIHKRSKRRDRAFVSVNCAAIPESLIASELFGHEKGSFTGAIGRRLGRFELADRGTIFLDEVGELPLETQGVLLRVLQENEFERVGGTRPIPVDVRVVAATNRDLKSEMAEGTFRSDLYYRLNVFPIEMPPLRDRKEDIPLLLEYFIDRYATMTGRRMRGPYQKTLRLFESYPWPGNIRELQNVVQRALIVCETENFTIDESWLATETRSQFQGMGGSLTDRLADQEKQMIEAALAECGGRVSGQSGAANKLGLPVSTLESKIQALKINKHLFKASAH